MKLYQFPNKTTPEQSPKATVTSEPKKLHLGPIGFTCPHCNNSTEFHSPGMIFRCVEFYCDQCGAYFKMVNPAFTPTQVPQPPKKPK